jgi:hypothetical protein
MFRGKASSVCLLFVFVLACLLSFSFYSGVSSRGEGSQVSARGGVKVSVGVGVYSDVLCRVGLNSIDWGELESGASKNMTVYVRNEGKSAWVLAFSTVNWNPSAAAKHISVNWNCDNKPVSPNKVVALVFTLSTSELMAGIDHFSFDIVLSL